MKKLRNQCISLGVMLLLIAVLISLLPEVTPLPQTQEDASNSDVAANVINAQDIAVFRRN